MADLFGILEMLWTQSKQEHSKFGKLFFECSEYETDHYNNHKIIAINITIILRIYFKSYTSDPHVLLAIYIFAAAHLMVMIRFCGKNKGKCFIECCA